jgi:hypothetical protein
MRNKILFFSLTLALYSCGFVINKQIIVNYYITATDAVEDLSICYHEPADDQNYGVVIEPMVFEVGYNEKYIIAKQHPCKFPNPPDTTITNYYILPLKKGMNWRTKNGLIGPLTLKQFNEKRKELGIVNIAFDPEFDFSK